MQRYRRYGASSEEPHSTQEAPETPEEVFEERAAVDEEVTDDLRQTGGGGAEEVTATRVPPLSDGKPPPPPSSESKSGEKASGGDAGTGAKYSIFTWFAVLALLGVWSSVAVVYFDIVDYDSVVGKLTAYDTDGDGDFDVEDAKVLLDDRKLRGSRRKQAYRREVDQDPVEMDVNEGISEEIPEEAFLTKNRTRGLKETSSPRKIPEEKEKETAEKQSTNDESGDPQGEESAGAHPPDPPTNSEAELDVDSEIQAAVPLPAFVEEDFVADDPREDAEHLHGEEADAIDTNGVSVEEKESSSRQSVVESAKDVTSSKLTQEDESPMTAEQQSQATGEQSAHGASPVAAAEQQTEPAEAQNRTPRETGSAPEDTFAEKTKEKARKKKPKLLNKLDKSIKAELDAAEKLRKKGKVEAALQAFEALVQKHPLSPRAHYGKAQAEDDLAEKRRSNDVLQKAIASYRDAAELPDAAPDLVRAALKRRAERQQFLGRMRGAVTTLERLVQIFPDDVGLKNDLGVAFLLLGDNKGAKKVYEEVLAAAPANGFAKVHYGFILKSENKIAESIPYLKEGLESGAPGTDDGRFYFHLGDALQRVGDESAYDWYRVGHERGHFASVWQRSLYNVDGLEARPWWTPEETGYGHLVQALERNWKSIRDEALAVMDRNTGQFVPEEENLREKGEWGQYTLWQQGKKSRTACQAVPKTCALLDKFPEATGCKRGQIKFSVMQPGTHVWPHTGPTNCRLRMHLGLLIPKHGCRIRCTDTTREWEEGKVLIFDDSFEHEVWQEADSLRLIFIVDVWHPQLTANQRHTLSAI